MRDKMSKKWKMILYTIAMTIWVIACVVIVGELMY